MRIGLLIPVSVLTICCALANGSADEARPDVEDILTGDPEAEDYVKSPRCLSTGRIRSVTALDSRHVVFRVSRNERYLVQFARPCPGIRRNDTLVYETTLGTSVCRKDRIRGTYGFGPGSRQLGPPCFITEFQSITPEQLDLLRDSLKQRKKR